MTRILSIFRADEDEDEQLSAAEWYQILHGGEDHGIPFASSGSELEVGQQVLCVCASWHDY